MCKEHNSPSHAARNFKFPTEVDLRGIRGKKMQVAIRHRLGILWYAKGDKKLIINGDWNRVVGRSEEREITGSYGLGVINRIELRLVELCNKHQLIISNTLFEYHNRIMPDNARH